MTWSAQVVHIMRKDLRQGRLTFLAYLSLLSVATAAEWGAASGQAFDVVKLTIPVVGMLALALTVQSDSPIRSDAFWMTRPLHPSAIVAAKLLLAVVTLVAPGLAAQWGALAAHGVAWSDLPFYLGRSASRYSYLLLAGAVVAGLTREMRSFLLITMLAPLGLLVLPFVFLPVSISFQSGGTWAFVVISLLTIAMAWGGGVALLLQLYRKRCNLWPVRAAGALVVLSVFVSMAFSSRVENPLSRDAPPSLREGRLVARLRPYSASTLARHFSLEVQFIEPPTRYQLVVTDPWLTLGLRDGSSLRIPLFRDGNPSRSAMIVSPEAALEGNLHWRAVRPGQSAGMTFTLELDNQHRRAVVDVGIARATFDGRIGLLRPERFGEVPLTPGATLGSGGYRVRIAAVNEPIDEPLIELSLSAVSPNRKAPELPYFVGNRGRLSYYLVHRLSNEALWLDPGGGGSRSGMLVLPGASVIRGHQGLGRPQTHPLNSELPVEPDWYRAAHLVVLAWVPVGSYQVRAAVELP